jgi:peptidoglycan hydrolase-like protein with peptidoglycan-binding domain
MRVILRRSPQGIRSPRGGHVIDLQRGLQQSGHSPQSIDGIFGGFTEAGVQSWQLAQGRQATGEVNELTWRGIVRTDPPALFRRCLALTAAFEGHGYTLALGYWDNAFITWGIVGFTLKGGNLGEVVRRIAARHPGLLERVIGDDRARALLDVIGATRARQQAFANAISLPPKKVRLQTDRGGRVRGPRQSARGPRHPGRGGAGPVLGHGLAQLPQVRPRGRARRRLDVRYRGPERRD